MAMFCLWSSSMMAMMVSLGTLTITSTFPTPIPEEPVITNSSRLNSSNISGTLFIFDTNETFAVQAINDDPAKTVHVEFVLRFPATHCCPVVYFYSKSPNSLEVPSHITKGCFHGGQSFHQSQHFVITDVYSHDPSCNVIENEYVCTGKRGFRSARSRSWFLAVGHKCGQEKALNLSLEIDVVLNRPSKCISFDHALKCDYNYTAFPNLLGHSHKVQALRYPPILMYPHVQCHQQFRAFSCRSLFPQCKSRQTGGRTSKLEVIMPCRKMCTEIADACRKVLVRWNQPLTCEAYPDSLDPEVCFYRQVSCPNPTPPEFGQVTIKGRHHSAISHFTCNGDFTMEGEASMNCTFEGVWNGTIPKCLSPDKPWFDNTKTALILTAAVIVSLAISVIIIMILRIRNISSTKVNPEKPPHPPAPVIMAVEHRRNIFLTYSSEDKDIVHDIWIPVMHTKLSSWRLITHETDFLPGRRVTECIEEAISDSDIVVALLTKNYLHSDWCMLELSHAQVKARRDPGFKLVLALHGVEEDKLPDAISEFKETWGILYLSDPLFWELLVKCLQA